MTSLSSIAKLSPSYLSVFGIVGRFINVILSSSVSGTIP